MSRRSTTVDPTMKLRPARSEVLSRVPGVTHGVSHRVEGLGKADGNIGLGTPRDRQDAWEMRRLWCAELGLDPDTIVTAGQVHGNEILRVDAADAGKGSSPDRPHLGMGDGMMTDAPGVTLLTLHADCQPILLVDPDRPAVAAVHAGWRGTALNIAGEAVAAMHQAYGSRPERTLAYLGPAIGGCCNEVGPEVTDQWRALASSLGIDPEAAITRPTAREHFDVPEANRRLLLASGLLDEHIDVSTECTKCDTDRWFSHRGHGANAGREGAFIAIRS